LIIEFAIIHSTGKGLSSKIFYIKTIIKMPIGKKWLLILFLSIPIAGFSQQDTLIVKLDSLARKKDSAGKQINNINPKAYKGNTQLNFNTYFILLGSSLKQEFTKPFHMTKKDWGNFGKFAAFTVALSFADEPIQQSALKLRERNTGINTVSKYVTNFGGAYEAITLAGLGAYGLIFKNQKLVTTTLLATQSYITAGALAVVLKFVSGRTRPSYYDPSVEAEPKFVGPFSKTSRDANGKWVNSSFPSGHTTVAFAAATVFASEYKDHPIVPIIAYSAATLIGLSRITENKHWTTDVFVGAVLGFLSGKQVVNNYHRFAKIKAPGLPKNSVSFNLNYSYGHWEPGMIYKFR
jgi:membrane-associated phospholipid phosphatase